jgi:hypothetical protein
MLTPFGNDASALSGCGGDRLLLAGRETGSSTLLVLAQTTVTDALFNTGNGNVTHLADGTEWYYSPSFSWGFAPGGETVNRGQCDVTSGAGRMCIHTFDYVGGWRINDLQGLNVSVDYEKLVFTSSSVPEPATWTLTASAAALARLARRRRKHVDC